MPEGADDLLRDACPIVGRFGAKHRTLRGAAGRLDDALTAAGIDHDITEYPDPGRSFLNQNNEAVFKIIGKAIGGGYDPAAARRRIATFFDRHLKTAR